MTQDARPLGSTYRLQLSGIGFDGARRQVGYLSDLGIETLYVSPVLAAVPGSTHGYDVIDPDRLDPALGSARAFESLLAELDAHHMRLLIDIVPNHLAAHADNRWWWRVLRDGPASDDAPVFDIDWSQHGGRVLLPVLSRPVGELAGSARLVAGHERRLEVDGQRFPAASGTRSGDRMAMLTHQHYRPAYWRLGRTEGNYRRFFDIDGLVGVRVEDPAVFERTHRWISRAGRDDRIAGWRVDHLDGLTDPAAYLQRLRRLVTPGRRTRAVVLVEKILARDERLPSRWETDGTTGYEFADLVGGLLVRAEGVRALAQLGAEVTRAPVSFDELRRTSKREVLEQSFPASLERLVRLALAALDQRDPGHDLSPSDIRLALAALTVHLDVYRTYLGADASDAADRTHLTRARAGARRHAELSGEGRRGLDLLVRGLAQPGGPWIELAQRWQQLTGAVMAKGVEDRATYRFSGLLGHADVGCDPGHAAAEPAEFHRLARHHRRYPSSLNTTSTHDSKRSEDARARLFTLSEVPEEWSDLVARWHRRHAAGQEGPAAHDELAVYQTMVALWPFAGPLRPTVQSRAQAYVVKAAREAKQHTGWVDPDIRYEHTLIAFVERLAHSVPFGREMARLMARIGPASASNSLAMLTLKMLTPGVPDLYQGAEMWDDSLTDPDNRRPVDFNRRRSLLSGLPGPDAPFEERAEATRELLSAWSDGRIKLFVTRSLLRLRRAHPILFDQGSYRALEVAGAAAPHAIAVGRRHGRRWVVGIVPRHVVGLAGPGHFATGTEAWGTTTVHLPPGAPGTFVDLFTGAPVDASRSRIRLAQCLASFPLGVLVTPPI